jgi:hypothetical protein
MARRAAPNDRSSGCRAERRHQRVVGRAWILVRLDSAPLEPSSESEGLGNLGASSATRTRLTRVPLYFPCISGIYPQRRVRPRLPPPPLSLRKQRLSSTIRTQTKKFPRFRGVFAVGLIRFRTGDGRFWVESARFAPFISVANSGGSDSLQISLTASSYWTAPLLAPERVVQEVRNGSGL